MSAAVLGIENTSSPFATSALAKSPRLLPSVLWLSPSFGFGDAAPSMNEYTPRVNFPPLFITHCMNAVSASLGNAGAAAVATAAVSSPAADPASPAAAAAAASLMVLASPSPFTATARSSVAATSVPRLYLHVRTAPRAAARANAIAAGVSLASASDRTRATSGPPATTCAPQGGNGDDREVFTPPSHFRGPFCLVRYPHVMAT